MVNLMARPLLRHPMSYMVPIYIWGSIGFLAFVVGILCFVLSFFSGPGGLILSIVLIGISVWIGAAQWFSYKRASSCCWRLSEDMVEYSYAFIHTAEESFQYGRIDEVSLYQSFFGRRYGYGTVRLTARGKDSGFILANVEYPEELHKFFRQIAAENRERLREHAER